MSSPLLELAKAYLQNEVRPVAHRLDYEVSAVREALQGLCERELMALRRPAEYGGPALPEGEFREFQLEVARVSGALAFLQTQHQSAVSMLGKSSNESLKQRTLPHMHNGDLLMAIGFSQLRRSGPPMLRAEPMGEVYVVNGSIPWVTGFDFFHEILVGATLPDGRALFFTTPFKDRPELRLSQPMRLAAMETAQTVTAEAANLSVAPEQVAFIHPANWIHENDMINVSLQGFFALGCARGSLDIIQTAGEKKNSEPIRTAYTIFESEWEACLQGLVNPPTELQAKLNNRAWAIELCGRFAQAAVAVTGGSANDINHPAQRLLRESIVYTVSAQTPAIMEATLSRLSSESRND